MSTSTGFKEARQGYTARGPVHTESSCAAVLPALRQVADMEDPDLDQPSLHRIVRPLEGSLGRLVLTRRAVDHKERLRFDAPL